MTRTTWSWIAAFILGSSLVGAMPASAQNATAPRLMIIVQDDASVPPKVLKRTKEEATRIFQDINVELIWLEHGDARFEDSSALKSVVIVHILSREMIDRMKRPDSVMGWAAPGTRIVKVCYSRIKALSGRTVHRLCVITTLPAFSGTSSLMRSDTCCFHRVRIRLQASCAHRWTGSSRPLAGSSSRRTRLKTSGQSLQLLRPPWLTS